MDASTDTRMLLRTADGSFTLRHEAVGETYHSTHGAVNESMHVFIKAGLAAVDRPVVRVLEVGLGTGLNLLLTWIRCLEGKCSVEYTALEPYPLASEVLEQLAHCEDLAWPGLHAPFLQMMAAPEGVQQRMQGGLSFTRSAMPVVKYEAENAYDVVYFDAFSPQHQPEMWTTEVFSKVFRALVPGGILVTYCAQGEARRNMQAAGFHVERLEGPPGKRHMVRATKPAP